MEKDRLLQTASKIARPSLFFPTTTSISTLFLSLYIYHSHNIYTYICVYMYLYSKFSLSSVLFLLIEACVFRETLERGKYQGFVGLFVWGGLRSIQFVLEFCGIWGWNVVAEQRIGFLNSSVPRGGEIQGVCSQVILFSVFVVSCFS